MNRRGFLTASVAIAALPLPATAFGQLPALDAYEATAQRLWQTMKDSAAELFRCGAPGTDAESHRILVNGAASMKAMRDFKKLPLETQLHPAVQQVMQTLSARLGESLVFVRAVMEEIAAGGRSREGDEVGMPLAMDEDDPLLADWAPRRADRRAIRRFQRSMTSEQRADAAGRVAARLRQLESRATWQPSSLETTDLDPETMRRVQRARANWANHPRSSKTLLGAGATETPHGSLRWGATQGLAGRSAEVGGSGTGGEYPQETTDYDALEEQLAAAVVACAAHLGDCGFELQTLVEAVGFAKLALLSKTHEDSAVKAVCRSDETRARFEVLAREVFIKREALSSEPHRTRPYQDRADAIAAIYEKLQQYESKADTSAAKKPLNPALKKFLCSIGFVATGFLVVVGSVLCLFGFGGLLSGWGLWMLPVGLLGLLMLWGGLELLRICKRALADLNNPSADGGVSTPAEESPLAMVGRRRPVG